MFRFMAEDRERVLALRAGRDPAATGSIQGSATRTRASAAPARPAAGARSRASQPYRLSDSGAPDFASTPSRLPAAGRSRAATAPPGW